MNNVTKGKWEVQDCIYIESGYVPEMDSIATVNEDNENYEANAELIITAVNQCKEINESNPMVVAKEIGNMKHILELLLDDIVRYPEHLEYSMAKAHDVLSKCEVKEIK